MILAIIVPSLAALLSLGLLARSGAEGAQFGGRFTLFLIGGTVVFYALLSVTLGSPRGAMIHSSFMSFAPARFWVAAMSGGALGVGLVAGDKGPNLLALGWSRTVVLAAALLGALIPIAGGSETFTLYEDRLVCTVGGATQTPKIDEIVSAELTSRSGGKGTHRYVKVMTREGRWPCASVPSGEEARKLAQHLHTAGIQPPLPLNTPADGSK